VFPPGSQLGDIVDCSRRLTAVHASGT